MQPKSSSSKTCDYIFIGEAATQFVASPRYLSCPSPRVATSRGERFVMVNLAGGLLFSLAAALPISLFAPSLVGLYTDNACLYPPHWLEDPGGRILSSFLRCPHDGNHGRRGLAVARHPVLLEGAWQVLQPRPRTLPQSRLHDDRQCAQPAPRQQALRPYRLQLSQWRQLRRHEVFQIIVSWLILLLNEKKSPTINSLNSFSGERGISRGRRGSLYFSV